MTFGLPVHQFDLEDYDPEQCAEWLLGIVDESPDKLAIIKIPPHRDEDDLDQFEELFRNAYDIAKAERPDLSVKLLHSVDLHNGQPRDRIAVAVHEHQWVGGKCVNGCPDTRKDGWPTIASERGGGARQLRSEWGSSGVLSATARAALRVQSPKGLVRTPFLSEIERRLAGLT